MYFKFIFGLLFIYLIVKAEKLKCFENSSSFKCKLSSIMPYRFIQNDNDTELKFPGCEAKKIWLLIRHGTRFPSEKMIKMSNELLTIQRKVLDNCNIRQCNLTEEQRQRLQDWKLNLNESMKMVLAEEGEDELIQLAERFQSRFPTLMPEIYSNDTFKFKFTQNQRTEKSAESFSIGLFGKYQSQNIWYLEPQKTDPILRFYTTCEKWQEEIKKNPEAYREFELFKNSTIIIKMLEDMSKRLGYTFNYDTANILKETCGYETAWNKETNSPWCTLLSTHEFELLEYGRDLKYYWVDGYGYELTYKQACSALLDMFDSLNVEDGVKTTAYFTHSGTMLKVLSLLGIAKDKEPLLHDNFNSSKDRLWKVSLIDAFATNIAFIYYDCKQNGPGILLMHQERIVNLSGCPENTPCPLRIMKELYPDNKGECEFSEMCNIN